MAAYQSTIPRQFLACVESFDKRDAFRHKQNGAWVDVPHREMRERVHALACALRVLKLAKADRVAILSENRLEWPITDLAILSAGGVTVPIYPTLIQSQVEYILRDAETRIVFVSSRAQATKIRELRTRLPMIERVIAYDPDAAGDGVESFADLMTLGQTLTNGTPYGDMISQTAPADWASIIYTSGTTGEPKGVILTHRNFMTNVEQCLDAFKLTPNDVYLSVLPLSHVFERTVLYTMMTAGVTVAYAESIETAMANLQEVRPTIVCFVPRIFEKFFAAIHDATAKGPLFKQVMFRWAKFTSKSYIAAQISGHHAPFNRLAHKVATLLVFKKIQQRVGGRLRFFVSGSAPLARNIIEFFYAAGLPILEGYGLTETSPVVTVNTFDHLRFGTVGRVVKGVEIRIAADGEILVRGDNVMQGYFKKPDATAEAIVDGWFHTGDIGQVDADGFLSITDRKKDLIATAGGKKVAPQPIELQLKHHPMVAEAVLVGNRRPFIALLIVPNFVRLEPWAQSGGVAATDRAALLASPEVHALYQGIVDAVNKQLAQFERIKSFTLLEDELTAASGDLTPTLKVRRSIVEAKYREKIDAMYGASVA